MKPMITVEKLAKSYPMRGGARHSSLREMLTETAKGLLRRRPPSDDDLLWALRDVSFDVGPGEVLGIVGNNGAGKSTILKILSRITEPTAGRINLYGRVGSLLEVGTGFHPELTGRENIFLNGAILGMKRREIQRKFDEIVAYAEMERFLDMPVKRYSSGMYMRLAFAVAAHLEPEILLLDEVLAVGDIAFQNKCLGKMQSVAREGRTVVFVSHSMSAIARLCTTALWIEHGALRERGPAQDVISHYMTGESEMHGRWVASDDATQAKLSVRQVRVKNADGEIDAGLNPAAPFRIEIDYQVNQRLAGAWVGFAIHTATGIAVMAAAEADDARYATAYREPGRYTAVCAFPANLLNFGKYMLSVQAVERVGNANAILVDFTALTFEVLNTGIASRLSGERLGVVCPQLDWRVSSSQESHAELR